MQKIIHPSSNYASVEASIEIVKALRENRELNIEDNLERRKI